MAGENQGSEMQAEENAAGAQAFRNLIAMVVLELSGWMMPECTSTMQYAFYNCANLTTIYALRVATCPTLG